VPKKIRCKVVKSVLLYPVDDLSIVGLQNEPRHSSPQTSTPNSANQRKMHPFDSTQGRLTPFSFVRPGGTIDYYA
jgi:hypothetical protein